jgi:hypothetical protein
MYLCEEYMVRHLIDIPYVKHIDSGCVFFKKKDHHRWSLLTINWQEPTWRPGIYHIRQYLPIHDGYKQGAIFNQFSEEKVHLDEYENYILEWRDGVKKIADGKEVRLAAWEICLYCYDTLLAMYVCRENFMASVNPELSIELRAEALDEVILYFKQHFKFFYEAWQSDLRRYIEGYAYWLAKLK